MPTFQERIADFGSQFKPYQKGEVVAVVGHGGSMQMLLCHFLKLPPEAFWRFRMMNTAVTEIRLYEAGGMLHRFNDSLQLLEESNSPKGINFLVMVPLALTFCCCSNFLFARAFIGETLFSDDVADIIDERIFLFSVLLCPIILISSYLGWLFGGVITKSNLNPFANKIGSLGALIGYGVSRFTKPV